MEAQTENYKYLLGWCTDIYVHWESVKPKFSKLFDLRTLEEWEETWRNLMSKLQKNLTVDSEDFESATSLYEQWEVLYKEAHPNLEGNESDERENSDQDLKSETLMAIKPFVDYGLKEVALTSYKHALTEIAAMAYLLGKGFDQQTAYKTVESWEVNEMFETEYGVPVAKRGKHTLSKNPHKKSRFPYSKEFGFFINSNNLNKKRWV